jgi:2-polyprenyl-3-methyl-5-hydroxy-6-metoxy-1,4-benzoquinol methylase
LLDVGCGSGKRLLEFRRLGWQVSGVEVSQKPAEIGRSLGLDIFLGELTEAPWPDGSFDTITLYHVLEHVHQPAVYLARIARLLTPGGIVLIAVPNFQSWERKIFQKNWAWLDVPFHLHHFEPARLLKLVAAAGLKTLDLRLTSAGPSFEHSLEKTRFQSTYAALRRLRVAPPLLAAFKTTADICHSGSGMALIAERPVIECSAFRPFLP